MSIHRTHFSSRSRFRHAVLRSAILGLGISGSTFVHAATITWNGGGGTNLSWSLPTNWAGTALPDVGVDVVFASGGSAAVIDGTSRSVGSVNLNAGGGFAISASGGASLTINTGIGVTSSSTYSISAPIGIASTGTWSVASGGTLNVSSVIAGANGIKKEGAGTLVLSGANMFTGTLSINSGTAVINSIANWGTASAIGAGQNEGTSSSPLGPYLTLDGGTLRYVGSGHSTNRTFKLGANGGTLDASGSGSLMFNNWKANHDDGVAGARTITLSGSSTSDNTLGLVLIDPGAGGTTSLLKAGAGRWVIPADVADRDVNQPFKNQYSGTTTIQGGVLEIQAKQVTIASNSVLSGGLANGGFWSAIGQSSNAPENLILNGGTLRYNYTDSADPANSPASTDASRWRAHDAGQNLRRFTLGANGGSLEVMGNGPLNLYNNGFVSVPGSGLRTLTLTGSFGDPTEGTNQYNAIAAIIADPEGGGSTAVVKDGTGEWVLNGQNTFTGSTTVNNGRLLLAHSYTSVGASTLANVLLPSSQLIVNGSGELELYTGDNGFDRANAQDHPFEGLSQTVASLAGSGTVNLNGGTLIINNSGSTTFSGPIIENGDFGSAEDQTLGRLIKSNTGTLILSGPLSYTGGTTVNHGTLTVSRLSTGTDSEFTNGPLVISAGAGSVATMRVTDKGTSSNNDLSGTSIVSSLSITAGAGGTATLDLTNNSMIINYTGSPGSLEDDIRQHMAAGKLTTSIATFGGPQPTRLGYADNAQLGMSFQHTTFSDVDVDASNLLIMFTYAGDTTLNGAVNSDDFNNLAGNFGASGKLWRQGDFTYEGDVNSDDFNLLATNFGYSGLARGRPPLADLYVMMLDYPLVYWSAKLRQDIWWRFEEFETWGLGDPPAMPDGVMGLVPEPGAASVVISCAMLLRRGRRIRERSDCSAAPECHRLTSRRC